MKTNVVSFPGISGQNVLVTASTSGIGLATARLLAASGASIVFINGRNYEIGMDVENQLAEQYPQTRFCFIQADLTVLPEVKKMMSTVAEQCRCLDSLVHCGGAQTRPNLFEDFSIDEYLPTLKGHLVGAMYACRLGLPLLKASGGGSIVIVASDAGKLATPGESVIGASKAAAIMFTRSIAMELSRYKIRANSVTPSILLNTKSRERVLTDGLSQKVFKKAERRAHLGVASGEDVAALIVFLISSQATKITGQAISVNGGISAA